MQSITNIILWPLVCSRERMTYNFSLCCFCHVLSGHFWPSRKLERAFFFLFSGSVCLRLVFFLTEDFTTEESKPIVFFVEWLVTSESTCAVETGLFGFFYWGDWISCFSSGLPVAPSLSESDLRIRDVFSAPRFSSDAQRWLTFYFFNPLISFAADSRYSFVNG